MQKYKNFYIVNDILKKDEKKIRSLETSLGVAEYVTGS